MIEFIAKYIWLILGLLPAMIGVCVAVAKRGTRITTDCPTAMKAAHWQSNRDDSWHLEG